MDPVELKNWLEQRTKDFAIATFRLLDTLPQKCSTRVISFQLGKSASSIGANYREANRAESKDDFTHKLSIALKEASESVYWFAILAALHPCDTAIQHLCNECAEIRNLLQSITKSVRATLSTNRRTHQSNNQTISNQTIFP